MNTSNRLCLNCWGLRLHSSTTVSFEIAPHAPHRRQHKDRSRVPEYTGLYFSQSFAFGLNSTAPLRQVTSLHWQPVTESHFIASDYIDRLYFDQNFSFGSLVIGRQRISWGTGRVWNPTDIFNPINPANFGKIEKDGSDAASMKFDLGQLTNLQIVYNAEYHFKYSDYAADFSLISLDMIFLSMSGFVDKRLVNGGDFAGDISGAGIRGEAPTPLPPRCWSYTATFES